MSKLSRHRIVAVLRAAFLVVVLGATVAFGADRAREASTPRGKLAPASFKISGKLTRALRPGSSEPLNLRLTNRRGWDLRITRITTAIYVDKQHDRAGCSRLIHYRQRRIPRRFYPLRLRARSTRTLRQLGVKTLPRIAMRNLPINQDACRGAKLRLRFVGRAERYKRPRAR